MTSSIRYCTSDDGVRIAYCVEGDGPALLMCLPNWFTFSHGIAELHANTSPLLEGRRSVRYDARGIGLSTRDPKELDEQNPVAQEMVRHMKASAERTARLQPLIDQR